MELESIRPMLALRVGIVGKRELDPESKKLLTAPVTEIVNSIRAFLSEVRREDWGYTAEKPCLYFNNSLAEGADQLAALAILAGHENTNEIEEQLFVPLPFNEADYLGNFTIDAEHAKLAYRNIIEQYGSNARLIALDGAHDNDLRAAQSYRAVASLLLDNSDLLIAICDMKDEGRTGGSVETVRRALRQNTPVIIINPSNGEFRLVVDIGGLNKVEESGNQLKEELKEDLKHVLEVMLALRSDRKHGTADTEQKQSESKQNKIDAEQVNQRSDFYLEPLCNKEGTTRISYKFIRLCSCWWKLITIIGRLAAISGNNKKGSNINKLDAELETSIGIRREVFKKSFEQTDALSIYYMDLYRSAFALNYLLGASAVLCALLAYFNPILEGQWTLVEIVCLIIIVVLYRLDKQFRWNERATDYRFLAEQFRHMAQLAPLCRVTPLTRLPAHSRAGDPASTWMNWYFRAVVRAAGFAGVAAEDQTLKLNRHYAKVVARHIKEGWIIGQRDYHANSSARYDFIIQALHVVSFVLFSVTLAFCSYHFLHFFASGLESQAAATGLSTSNWRSGAWLTITVAVFPAFLAALHSISRQSEIELLSQRYKGMASQLNELASEIDRHVTSNDTLCPAVFVMELGKLACDSAVVMLEEVDDWRRIHILYATELT